ncbi:MAG: FG-GAP repeat domain-containing protein, partial [Candidatus Acidiferrales bacterium]
MASGVNAQSQGSPNPIPTIVQPLVPSSVPPGSAPFGLTVNGTGFAPGAQVNWNGSARITSFLSDSRLLAIITDVDVALAGTAAISVTNPSPGGGTSNSVSFGIANPVSSFVFSNLTWHGAPGIGPLITADFNGDGKPDLAVSVDSLQLGGPTQLSILLANGDGTYQDSLTYSLGSDLSPPIVADFNGDGKLDLAVASSHDDTVSILLGNGDGTFQSPLIFTVGHADRTVTGPVALVAGDFNRDGKLDLALALQFSGTAGILPGNGDGTFGAMVEFPANEAPTDIVSADFNGDGILDLVLSGPGGISLLLGNGDGTFQ